MMKAQLMGNDEEYQELSKQYEAAKAAAASSTPSAPGPSRPNPKEEVVMVTPLDKRGRLVHRDLGVRATSSRSLSAPIQTQ